MAVNNRTVLVDVPGLVGTRDAKAEGVVDISVRRDVDGVVLRTRAERTATKDTEIVATLDHDDAQALCDELQNALEHVS